MLIIPLAVTHVHEYHEDDLDPPAIGPNSFFVRTALLYRRKYVKVGRDQCANDGVAGGSFDESARILQPPLGENTCVCLEAYNPYPLPALQECLDAGPTSM